MNRRQFLSLFAAAPLVSASLAAAAPRFGARRKKGVGVVAKPDGKWLETVNKLKVEWFYTWGSGRPSAVPVTVDFIPMIWGYWGDKAGIARLGEAAKSAGVRELLGFNEPDEHTQSNISVGKALDAWPDLMKTGLRLGSPGCVHPDNAWMKAFMKGVDERRLRVDFICMHAYPGTDAKAFLNHLENIHRAYQRPLWITEFACGDWQAKSAQENRHKPAAVLKFMEQVLPRLEQSPFVERYAWFSSSPGSAALGTSALLDRTGALTELGNFYQSV